MTDVSGIPNMGFGGGGYFGGIPNQQPAMSAAQINQGIWGNYSPQQAQNTLNNIYGPGGFGGDTARYAALGAAYGRATGGYGGYGAANADPFTPVGGTGANPGNVQRGPDLQAPPWQNPITSSPWEGAGFDPVQYLNANPDVKAAGANPWEHAQRFGFNEGRSGMGWNPVRYLADNPDVKAAGANPWEHAQNFGFKEGRAGLEGLTQTDAGRNSLARVMAAGGGGDNAGGSTAGGQTANPYAQMFRMPQANPEYFNKGIYSGSQGSYGIPYNGAKQPGDIGFSAQPQTPNLGYNPGMQNWFANPGMNANQFQNRFGLGFGGQAPTQMPDYSSNPLTAMDRLGVPHQGFRMDQQ